MSRCCVFIDGENFRHSICDLLRGNFDQNEYLPRQANWTAFFDHIVSRVILDSERLRTYWYVVAVLDCYPYKLKKLLRTDKQHLRHVLSKHKPYNTELSNLVNAALDRKLQKIVTELDQRESSMRKRFRGWQEIQNGISLHHDAIEFRRSGSIRYDLYTREIGTEKAVDVHLGIDLLRLKDIYDYAIIVSGDQDYVPAVEAVKDLGKRVVNVAFLDQRGKLLPGGARRLNQTTDRSVTLNYTDVFRLLLGNPR